MDLFIQSDALFCECERYRKLLRRRWADGPLLAVMGYNPSLARVEFNDMTLTLIHRRAFKLGYPGFAMLNAYAAVTPYPTELWKLEHPDDPTNDQTIAEQLAESRDLLCAWGGAIPPARLSRLVTLIKASGVRTYCLAVTKDGHPRHPLRVPYAEGFKPYVLPDFLPGS